VVINTELFKDDTSYVNMKGFGGIEKLETGVKFGRNNLLP
jgi:hypothetical protein